MGDERKILSLIPRMVTTTTTMILFCVSSFAFAVYLNRFFHYSEVATRYVQEL
jgi:uncharacterized BrkB/YihY/UPF0761 family membrane protein